MTTQYFFIITPALFAICFGGLSWVLLKALASGAEEYSGTYTKTTSKQFEDVFLFIPPRHIAEAAWACAVAAFTIVFFITGDFSKPIGLLIGLLLGSLAAFGALKIPRALFKFLKERRRRRFNAQLVDALNSMGNSLKAGFSINQSFENIANNSENPMAQEFEVFLQQVRVGMTFEDALHSMDQRVGSDDLTLVLMAIETARRTGGNLTEIFKNISETIRERLRIENRIRTLTAMGRLQGIILSAMPIVIAVAISILRPDIMRPFMHSHIGIVLMSLAVLMIVSGGFVIRKIIRIDI